MTWSARIEVLSVLATGEDVIGFETRLVCADGSVRRFEWNTRTMPHLGVVYGIARDVTERAALTEEQAALRRVATLVARESPPDEVFAAVAEELGRLLGATSTALYRFEDDGTATLVGRWGELHGQAPLGASISHGRQQHRLAGVQDRAARAHRRLRGRERRDREDVQGAGRPRRSRRADHRRRAGCGARWAPPQPSRCRRTRSPGSAEFSRAGRHRDREHRSPFGAHRVAGADRGRGRRGAAASRARPARRGAAAPRPHGDHAQARAAGARARRR